MDFTQILNIVLGVLAVVLGGYLTIAKGKLKAVITAGKELIDVAQSVDKALTDNKISEEEKEDIKKQWNEAKGALKAILK